MRMWKVDPTILCNKHLLGEHLEMHMFEGAIRLGKSIEGYIEKGLVETGHIKARHDALAEEMNRRGMKHKTPMKDIQTENRGKVDTILNMADLAQRCEGCKERIVMRSAL